MASSSAFSIGMLRVIAAASAPSASIHFASGLTPASARIVASGTPVHSQQLRSPCVSWTVSSGLGAPQFWVLPEHSRKWMRDTDGNRVKSSMVKISGLSTMPWTISRCSSGSIVGVPAWWRS